VAPEQPTSKGEYGEEEQREQDQPEREEPRPGTDHPHDLARVPGLLEPVCLAGVVRADPDGDPREDQQEQRSDPECPSHVVPPFDGFRLIGPMLPPGCERIVNPPGRFRGDPDL